MAGGLSPLRKALNMERIESLRSRAINKLQEDLGAVDRWYAFTPASRKAEAKQRLQVAVDWLTSASVADIEAVEAYCNARTTYSTAGGHEKAARNKSLMQEHQARMEAEGIPVPSSMVSAALGVFNGRGTT